MDALKRRNWLICFYLHCGRHLNTFMKLNSEFQLLRFLLITGSNCCYNKWPRFNYSLPHRIRSVLRNRHSGKQGTAPRPPAAGWLLCLSELALMPLVTDHPPFHPALENIACFASESSNPSPGCNRGKTGGKGLGCWAEPGRKTGHADN